MKKIFLLCLLITGCTSVPIKPSFPKVPPELQNKCASLQTLANGDVSPVDMLKTVVTNYTLYHECATKVEGWQFWYREQEKLYR